MHVTLHLTTGCNMACDYCYSPSNGKREDMPWEVIEAAVNLASRLSPGNAGIIFFGGEPLLRKDIIIRTLEYCHEKSRRDGCSLHYKVTTNGLLLEEDFLKQTSRLGLHFGLSIDGAQRAHDRHRKTPGGRGTHEIVSSRVRLLLGYQPYASALLVVNPDTVNDYASSFRCLIDSGFRYVIASLNYAADWTETDLVRLEKQYRKLARLYERLTVEGHKFYFSPFEKKLASHIHGREALCQQCHFGVRQISVAPNGDIYPCVQFVKGEASSSGFSIGNVWLGIDKQRQAELFALSRKENQVCDACALRDRCEHHCSCLNWQTTGTIDAVSPKLCATEQILIPIVDRMGESLYRRRAPLFIQKHYNPVYPLISFFEDLAD